MKPTVGRIVHWYESYDKELKRPRAATIYEVSDLGTVTLFGFWPSAIPFEVPFSAKPEPGHWTWPERVA